MKSSDLALKEITATSLAARNVAEKLPTAYGYVDSRKPEAEVPNSVGFLDYWHTLIRDKVILLVFALAGLIVAILISVAQTPKYRARTSLQIHDFNENFMDMKSVDPTDPSGNYFTAESYFQTQVKILESDSLLERVINKMNLRQASPTSGWRAFAAQVRRFLGLPGSSLVPDNQSLIRQAQENLTVRTAGNTRLLEVLYDSPDPKLAADFANTLVNEFIDQSQELRWKATQRTGEWLTRHLEEMKADLERSEAQLQDYAHTSGLMFNGANESVGEERLKELQDEFSKAEADRIAKEAKFETAKNKSLESLPEMLDDPTLRDYRVKLTDLQRQLVELTATLTPAHYKVKRVQAQIAELRSALQKQRGLILHRIGNEYAGACRREDLLAKSYAQQEKVVADQSSKAIRYDTLKREVDSSRRLYEAMLERVKQAQLASAMRVSNVLIVDPAKPPPFPYRPRVLLNSGLGLLSGICLGLSLVLLRGHFDRRMQAPGDVQTVLNDIPELGALPLAELGPPPTISTSKRNLLKFPTRSQPALRSCNGYCPELAMWNSKPSLLAECVRGTVTSILLTEQNGTYPRALVLTSACEGDGKTTVASNLSIALAETGLKVLLIDGDVRHPRLHKIFGVCTSSGLAEVLSGLVPLDDAIPLVQLVVETKIPGVCLLPTGSCAPDNASQFFSPNLARLLLRARAEFDIVVIDAPPMSQLTDARLLARLSDGVILVMRAGRTTAQTALMLSQRFAEDRTPVLGTVLNAWDPKRGAGYGYYGAYYNR